MDRSLLLDLNALLDVLLENSDVSRMQADLIRDRDPVTMRKLRDMQEALRDLLNADDDEDD